MAEATREVRITRAKPEPLSIMMAPFEQMEHWFEAFWASPLRAFGSWPHPFGGLRAFAPSVDVIDEDQNVVVRAEVPGFDKDDIEVSVSDDTLTIRGGKKTEEKRDAASYYRCEIHRESFSRTLLLPAAVDDAKAKATMKDGILELTLPKVEKTRRQSIRVE